MENGKTQWKQVVFFGLFLFSAASFFAVKSLLFGINSVRTTGTVVDFAYSGGDQCFPIVEFITTDGKTVKFRNSSKELELGIGVNQFCERYEKDLKSEAVTVIYKKNDPENAVINTFFNRWMLSSILFVIASLTIAAGFELRKT